MANFQILLLVFLLTNFAASYPSRKKVTYVSKPGEPSNVRYISKVEENGKEVEEQKVKLNCKVYKKTEAESMVRKKEDLIAVDETQKPLVKKDIQDPSENCREVNTAQIISAPDRLTNGGCGPNKQKDPTGRCRAIA